MKINKRLYSGYLKLVNEKDHYQDDFTQMVVQPISPCRVRYVKRKNLLTSTEEINTTNTTPDLFVEPTSFQIHLDRELCQGHATCMAEAPELFHVDEEGNVTVLQDNLSINALEKARLAEKYCPTKAILIKTTNT